MAYFVKGGADTFSGSPWNISVQVAEGLHLSLCSHIKERPISSPAVGCLPLTTHSPAGCQ